jgi:hypothetical protein
MNLLKKIWKNLFPKKEPDYCVECFWHSAILGGGKDVNDLSGIRCKCPKNSGPPKIELTTGKIIEGSDIRYENCKDAREDQSCINGRPGCGPEGNWFKSRLPPSGIS